MPSTYTPISDPEKETLIINYGWSVLLVTALSSWGNPVPCGHISDENTPGFVFIPLASSWNYYCLQDTSIG
jgi:hypothetical protein